MKNISFMLTPDQIVARTKTVTRRLGWLGLKPGTLLRPVRKGMGLRKGEKLDVLGNPIRVVSVMREPLRAMTDDIDYGFSECELEGFKNDPLWGFPVSFVERFCLSHKGCTPETIVTRIEFEYTENEL